MKPADANRSASGDAIAAAAAAWVMRHDRGLSPDEQDRYLQWLAANPRHAEAMKAQRNAWEAFDRLAGLQAAVEAVPDPDLLLPYPSAAGKTGGRVIRWRYVRPLVWPLALAAAAALTIVFWRRDDVSAVPLAPPAGVAAIIQLAPIEERVLEDGLTIRLNRGAIIAVEFSATERRVRLDHGEACFTVTKDAERPFVVMTAGVAVRAVGTAFNVRLGDRAVDVIVTEGSVAVTGASIPPEITAPIVEAGKRAVVPLETADVPPTVDAVPAEELARRLAWQPRMLTFIDESVMVIVDAFNRHNPVTLRVEDPGSQDLRLSMRFRSDNVQGFLRLLESDFGMRADHEANGDIVLRLSR